MDESIRIQTKVLPGHRIEISAPQWSEGASVDVLVMLKEQPKSPKMTRDEILRMPIEQRRQLLAQQSEHMAAHYGSDAERFEWQGGDIIE
jgi:hypothetical protein